MNLIFLGPPGAGKGTHAQNVCKRFGLIQISTGDILRAAIADATPTGLKAKAYMDQGQLVPDQVVIDIVKERLAMEDCQNGYILDGFPRTVAQAEALDQFASIDLVVTLSVSDEVIVKRLGGRRVCPKCGAPYHVSYLNGSNTCSACGTELIQRDDDKEETILKRLEVYHQKTAPLIAYYQNQGKLVTVETEGDMQTNAEKVIAAVEALV